MNIYSKEYINTTQKYYNKYVVNDEPFPEIPPADLRPEIFYSWQRSKSHSINPVHIESFSVTENELNSILEDNSRFLGIAEPYLKSIYTFIKGSDFIIHVTDSNGHLLKHYAEDDTIIKLFKETARMKIGSTRNESISGTDSTSLCIRLDKAIQVIGPEHYIMQNHAFFCSSSPIHDISGNLIAVLTIMGPVELYQKHTLGMAYAATTGIELALRNHMYTRRIKTSNLLLNTTLNNLDKAIVVVDENNSILEYNKRFTEIFNLPATSYVNTDLFTIFSRDSIPAAVRDLDKDVSDFQFTMEALNRLSFDISLTVRNIGSGMNGGKLKYLMFDEQKKINSFVGKITNPRASFTFSSILGQSAAISETKQLAANVSNSSTNILILGESGTGKELFAQAIHNSSSRRDEPFIAINCSSIPKNLVESELFGYEGGAFTSAKKEGSPGKFELADKGTLFLDEIGDMPLELQGSLLRVLQSHEVMRVGGKKPKHIDVRIIAATNVDLIEAVNNKTFRSDLYYRLNVLNILLPPLRKRPDDIPLLASHFIEVYSTALKKEACTISSKALLALVQYQWPGNVRELENVIERAINIMEGDRIEPAHLPEHIKRITDLQTDYPAIPYNRASSDSPVPETAPADTPSLSPADTESYSPEIMERDRIIAFMKQEKGHVPSVARHMGMPASTLYRKLRKYKITAKKYKEWGQ